nr:hypothetical protein CFP56_61581 [Quercus suber]
MTGNELDKSNQPPLRAIWKPPPWPILKVNSDDAKIREQNSVGVVSDMGGGLVLFWRLTIDKIVEVGAYILSVQCFKKKIGQRLE